VRSARSQAVRRWWLRVGKVRGDGDNSVINLRMWATRVTINERRHKRIVISELITMNDTEPRVRVVRDQTPTRTGVPTPATRTGFQNPCILCLYVAGPNIRIKGL